MRSGTRLLALALVLWALSGCSAAPEETAASTIADAGSDGGIIDDGAATDAGDSVAEANDVGDPEDLALPDAEPEPEVPDSADAGVDNEADADSVDVEPDGGTERDTGGDAERLEPDADAGRDTSDTEELDADRSDADESDAGPDAEPDLPDTDPDAAGDADAEPADAAADTETDADPADVDGGVDADTVGEDADTAADSDSGSGTDADSGSDPGDGDTDDVPPLVRIGPPSAFVQVVDAGGSPIAGASVAFDTRARLTTELGDARFLHAVQGKSVVTINAQGTIGGLWEIEVPHVIPAEADIAQLQEIRQVAVLHSRAPSASIRARTGGTASNGPIALSVPGRGVLDIHGERMGGPTRIDVSVTALDRDSLALGVGSGLSVDRADGSVGVLSPHVIFDAELRDETGVPVHPAPDEVLTITYSPEASAGLSIGDSVSVFLMDPVSARWKEQAELTTTVRADGLVEIEVPHVSRWALGSALDHAPCARVTIPGAGAYGDAMLGIRGLGVDTLIPVKAEVVDLSNVGVGDTVDVRLVVSGKVLATTTLAPVAESDGDVGSCAEFGAAARLAVPGVFVVGEADSFLRVSLRAGGCTSEPQRIEIETSAGEPVSGFLPQTGTFVVSGLARGDYRVLAVSDDGATLAGRAFSIECDGLECPLEETSVNLPYPLAASQQGGCGFNACIADECDRCISVLVSDLDDEVVPDATVYVSAPVDDTMTTDEAGLACMDIQEHSDLAVDVRVAGSRGVRDVLPPRGGRCDLPGTCAMVPLRLGTSEIDRISCGGEAISVSQRAVEWGWMNPGYLRNELIYAADEGLSGVELTSVLVVEVGEGLGETSLGSSFRATETVAGDAFAYLALRQDHEGQEELRQARIPLLTGAAHEYVGELVIDLSATTGASAFDELVTIEHSGPSGRPELWAGVEGTVELDQTSSDLRFTVDGVFENDIGQRTGLRLSGVAPILRAGVEGVRNIRGHLVNGELVRVLTATNDQSVRQLTGAVSRLPDPSGEFDFCAPTLEPYQVVGTPSAGRMGFASAVLTIEDGAPHLAGNLSADPGVFVPNTAMWWDEETIVDLYLAHGLDPMLAYTRGTLIGLGQDESGALVEVGEALLSHPEFGVLEGSLVDDTLRASSSSNVFVFLDLDQTSIDDAYELSVHALGGEELTGLNQLIAPRAGSVTVPHALDDSVPLVEAR